MPLSGSPLGQRTVVHEVVPSPDFLPFPPILLQALARDPDDRIQDFQTLIERIELARTIVTNPPSAVAEPDGDEDYSLTRIVPAEYGNDVANWEAAEPTPGE